MRGHFHFSRALLPHSGAELMLVICFLCGILCGMAGFFYNEAVLSTLFTASLDASPGISDFFLSLFLPFLFAAISLSVGCVFLLLLVCFGKAFLFGFVSLGICLSLKVPTVVCFMFFLSSSLSLVLLYGFCRFCIRLKEIPSLLKMVSFFLVILALGLFLYFRFIPAAAVLSNF